jgi:hypothetical protein
MGYAAHAYADANGVTMRLRQQMKLTNQRKGSTVIAPEVISQVRCGGEGHSRGTAVAERCVVVADVE